MKLSKIEKATFKYDDAEFTIKELLSGDILDIQDKAVATTIEIVDVNGEMVPSRTIKPSSMTERFMVIQKCIIDWKNINSADGKELVCDSIGKKTFCENLPEDVFNDFYKVLTEERKKLSGVVKKQAEKTVKN